ncbi:hypothetical protein VTN77DRAFT_3794 [Rasamsonia byssochlamydoides]|uniref:uncharacterized protein n=1 Tax=Rasamsonia byssochlamydoides TaxID=89139 RepID=UPI0037424B37
MNPPRNRKQRRAAASSASDDSFDPSSIPLAHPPPEDASKNKRQGKTLIEIAAERQKELQALAAKNGKGSAAAESTLLNPESAETQYLKISPSGEVSRFDPGSDASSAQPAEQPDAPLPPFIDTLLLSFPLSALHFTLAFLAAHQYLENIPLRKLAQESIIVAFPVLTFCIHLAHGHVIPFGKKSKSQKTTQQSTRWTKLIPSLRTILFLLPAICLGGYLIKITNDEPYYAVMKRAPAIGTLWVWCVLEMSAGAAVLAVLAPLGWGVLWKGYGII